MRGARGVGRGLWNMVESGAALATDPIRTLRSAVWDAGEESRKELEQAAREHGTLDTPQYTAGRVMSYIPVLGPMGLQMGRRAAEGDVAGTLGEVGTYAAAPEVAGPAMEAGGRLAARARAAAPRLAEAVRAGAREAVSPENVGMVLGGAAGELGGRALGLQGTGLGTMWLGRNIGRRIGRSFSERGAAEVPADVEATVRQPAPIQEQPLSPVQQDVASALRNQGFTKQAAEHWARGTQGADFDSAFREAQQAIKPNTATEPTAEPSRLVDRVREPEVQPQVQPTEDFPRLVNQVRRGPGEVPPDYTEPPNPLILAGNQGIITTPRALLLENNPVTGTPKRLVEQISQEAVRGAGGAPESPPPPPPGQPIYQRDLRIAKPAPAASTPPAMTPVESTVFKGYSHEPESKTLTLFRKDGSAYEYGNVSPELAEGFKNAESKGNFWSVIKKDADAVLRRKSYDGGKTWLWSKIPQGPARQGVRRTSEAEDLTPTLKESVRRARAAKGLANAAD